MAVSKSNYRRYESTFVNRNPTELFVLDESNKITTKPFDIFDWVCDEVKELFDKETILKAIKNLGFVFNDVMRHSNSDIYVGRNKVGITPKGSYSIYSSYNCEEYDNKRLITNHWVEYSYIKPNDLVNDDIINECFLIKYPKLKELTFTKSKVIGKDELQNSHISLNDLPKQIWGMSINDIMALNEDIVIEEKVKLLSYYNHSELFFLSLPVIDGEGKDSVYIPKNFFSSGDFDVIVNYHRDYFKDYHKNDAEKLAKSMSVFEHPNYLKFKEIISEYLLGSK